MLPPVGAAAMSDTDTPSAKGDDAALSAVAEAIATAPALPSAAIQDRLEMLAENGEVGDIGSLADSTDDGGGEDSLHYRLAWLPQTDLGNVERFVARHQRKLKFCPAIGWLAWDGRRWDAQGGAEAAKRAEHTTVRSIQFEAVAVARSGKDREVGA